MRRKYGVTETPKNKARAWTLTILLSNFEEVIEQWAVEVAFGSEAVKWIWHRVWYRLTFGFLFHHVRISRSSMIGSARILSWCSPAQKWIHRLPIREIVTDRMWSESFRSCIFTACSWAVLSLPLHLKRGRRDDGTQNTIAAIFWALGNFHPSRVCQI